MEATLKQIDVSNMSRQHKAGYSLIAVGVVLLLVGLLFLRSTGDVQGLNVLVRNLTPLIPFAGIVLIGQGAILLRLKGRRMIAWFMALPGATFITVIVIFPMFYALGVSFVEWNIQTPQRSFIFLENYATVLTTGRVWDALWNSVYIVGGEVIFEFLIGIGLALLFTEQFRGRSLFLSILLIPLMMAPVVVAQTWRMLWNTRFGAVNHFLSIITGRAVELQWLSNPDLALPALVVTGVWQWTPFVFIITLAGMLTINRELYEAAAIDGASSWQMFSRITLPILRPVLLVALLFRLIDALKLFDFIYVMTQGGPGYDTETIPYYLYQQGFTYGRFGYTAAGSLLFLILVILVCTILIQQIGEL